MKVDGSGLKREMSPASENAIIPHKAFLSDENPGANQGAGSDLNYDSENSDTSITL